MIDLEQELIISVQILSNGGKIQTSLCFFSCSACLHEVAKRSVKQEIILELPNNNKTFVRGYVSQFCVQLYGKRSNLHTS